MPYPSCNGYGIFLFKIYLDKGKYMWYNNHINSKGEIKIWDLK